MVVNPNDDVADLWLAPWFQHPARSELATGHHLRPLRMADAGLPGLPDGLDLEAAAAACNAREAYVYGVFDDEERAVLGTVHLGPGQDVDPPVDVVVRWSVPGCPSLADAVEAHLGGWLDRAWPFASRLVVGD